MPTSEDIQKALEQLKQELESPQIAQVLADFDANINRPARKNTPRKTLPKAKRFVVTCSYECPNCMYFIEHPDTGHSDWSEEDTQSALKHYKGEGAPAGCVICNFCDAVVRIK